MKTRHITLFTAFAAAAVLAPTAQAGTIYWGGGAGLWSTATNWSGGVLPGASDSAEISSAGSVTHASGTHTVVGIKPRNASTLTVTGGTLTATLHIDIGKNAGNLLVVSGGTLTAARVGALSGTAGSTFRIDGSSGTINTTDLFSTSASGLDLVMDAGGISTINLANNSSNAAWDLTVDTTGYGTAGGTFTIINYTGAGTVQTFASVLVDGVDIGLTDHSISYTGGTGNDVVLTLEASGTTPAADPEITSITSLGGGSFELTLKGGPSTSYEFYSSATLDFTSGGTLVSLTGGGTDVTTDGSGDATVQMTLTGSANFVRAQ